MVDFVGFEEPVTRPLYTTNALLSFFHSHILPISLGSNTWKHIYNSSPYNFLSRRNKRIHLCKLLLNVCVRNVHTMWKKNTQAQKEHTKNSKHKESRRNRNPSIMYLHCTLERCKCEMKTHRNIHKYLWTCTRLYFVALHFDSRLQVTAHCTFM